MGGHGGSGGDGEANFSGESRRIVSSGDGGGGGEGLGVWW